MSRSIVGIWTLTIAKLKVQCSGDNFSHSRECYSAVSPRYSWNSPAQQFSWFQAACRGTGGGVGWRPLALVRLQNQNGGSEVWQSPGASRLLAHHLVANCTFLIHGTQHTDLQGGESAKNKWLTSVTSLAFFRLHPQTNEHTHRLTDRGKVFLAWGFQRQLSCWFSRPPTRRDGILSFHKVHVVGKCLWP